MNNRIFEIIQCMNGRVGLQWEEEDKQELAVLIVRECLDIVKSNTYGPGGEYDYSYSDKGAAADKRAETIHEEIAYHFGVEQ